jgi:hypothetical protein
LKCAFRFPFGPAPQPFAITILTAFLLAGPIYDYTIRGRIHSVYISGGLLIFVSGPLRPVIGNSALWHKIAYLLIQ